MKIVLEIPDSLNNKKSFSKDKFEQEIRSILFLKLYQEGYIPFQDFALAISTLSKKKVSKKKPTSPAEKFLKLQGIWKDRTDIKDSVEYLQTLRNKIASREI